MTTDVAHQCAVTVMETLRQIMPTVRPEKSKRGPDELSFIQFHALMSIKRHEGLSLSQAAEHLGATISTASKIIDGLVERGMVFRTTADEDRRKLMLKLTPSGERAVEEIHLKTIANLTGKLETLSPSECAMVELAMGILRSTLISSDQPIRKSE
ncbi:MAG: MarR family transcriptional regulator [bacterium]|jgi:DNA-binding MarR family transcriptional regulator